MNFKKNKMEIKDFKGMHNGDYFPTGKGWKKLVFKLVDDINKMDSSIEVLQVKEKFGGLRFYIGATESNKYKEIDVLIDIAEQESYHICESCGTTKGVSTKGSWVKTFCDKCRTKMEKRK